MELPKKCIISGSSEDLNTKMSVKIDGVSYDVWISDDHAESSTISEIKAAVVKHLNEASDRDKEIEELKRKAKELGLVLFDDKDATASVPEAKMASEPLSAPTPPAPKPTPAPASRLVNESSDPNKRMIDGKVADQRKINAAINSEASSFGVAGAGSEYDISSTDKPSEDLKEGEKAEIGIVKSTYGEVAIPIRRVGKMGETKIRVKSTGGDAELQRRFKELAKQSETDPYDFKKGYQVRSITCGLCRGTGRIKSNSTECPKCDGLGTIDI